jgi:WD40 repeat protein
MRVLQSRHPRPLDLLAIGAGGHIAAACSQFDVRADVELWDLSPGVSQPAYPTDGYDFWSLVFTPSGTHLLIGSDRLKVLTLATGEVGPVPGLELNYPEVALSADGRLLVACTRMNQAGAVGAWAVGAEPEFVRVWANGPHEFIWFHSPSVSPDGTRVAVGVNAGYDRARAVIDVRRAADGDILHEIALDPTDPTEQLAFTADGSKLLARFLGRTVRAFDAQTGEPAGELVHKGRPFVTGLAVHPGGRAIATTRTDGTVWFWDPATLRQLRSFDWKLGKLVSVAFSPDGSLAAAGTERGQVVVWDVDV